MTTIAYCGKMLAGDRKLNIGDTGVTAGSPKVIRTADGRLLGAAGPWGACGLLLAFLSKPKSRRRAYPECQHSDDDEERAFALEVMPDGTLWVHEGATTYQIEAPFAYGSGMAFALGAMAAGKTAGEAVAIAAMFDNCTGRGVDVLHLDR